MWALSSSKACPKANCPTASATARPTESGAQEVWLLFPETQRVVRYTAPFEATILHADDALTTPLAPDFRVRVGDLFAVV